MTDVLEVTLPFPATSKTQTACYALAPEISSAYRRSTVGWSFQKAQVLTEHQTEDYERFEYQCRDMTEIPGKIPMMRGNILIVNGHRVRLEDSLFALLLRLVLQLEKERFGWIDLHSLERERVISNGGNYQVFSRLREKLEGSLSEKDSKNFIENDGSKRYRISTHPDFIRYDKDKLLQHPDEDIRRIAAQLP